VHHVGHSPRTVYKVGVIFQQISLIINTYILRLRERLQPVA